MKRGMKKAISLLLVLCTILSIFASLTVSAASFSYNPGKRGTACTSLSSKAKSYYTGSYVYSTLSKQSASTIKSSLKTLMTNTHKTKTTYENLKSYTKYSDAYAGSSSKIIDFYSGATYSGTWDNGKTWNREHVWCQSLGSFTTSNCGSDLHHLRPTDPTLNSTRNNTPFGEVSGSYKTAKSKSGAVGGYYTSTYFEPLDNVKGDVARILLYCHVRWGESNITKLISSTSTLLSWMKSDPVDTYEMGRNDVVQGIQGNRNVFIDYPEYAWLIYGQSIPKHTTPSGIAKSGSTSSGSGSGSGSNSGSTTTTTNSKTFTKVTSTSKLTSGNYVLVVKVGTGTNKGSSKYYAIKAQTVNSSYVAGVSADSFMGSSAPSSIKVSDSTIIWKLSGSSSSFTLANGSNYLIGSSNNLYCKSGTATKWKATVSSGVWTIKNGTRYLALRPDLALGSNGCPRFRCNSSAVSTNYAFYLYKQS